MLQVHGDDLLADCKTVVGSRARAPVGWDALAAVLVVVAVGILVGTEKGHHGGFVAGAGLQRHQHQVHSNSILRRERTDSADGISSYKNVAAP